jgi:xylulokinase
VYWLGIDVGTGGSRALLVDADGRVRHSFIAPHADMRMERPLWAEQDPEDWWSASRTAIAGVLNEAGVAGSAIRGIGLTGQMHGLVLLDAALEVIRPALIWCDQRSQQQVDFINSTLGANNVVRWTANPVLTGFTLPKFLWVRDKEPQAFERARHFLLPKDFLRFKLTDELATDVSDASGTSMLDVVNRQWSKEIMTGLGLDASILPRLFESREITGRVSEAAAQATGLARGTPVVAGAGDQAASAIGNGIVQQGTVSCTIGTSGVVFAFLKQPAYDPYGRVHTFCHAMPNAWHVMGVTQGAGLSLQWFRSQLASGLSYDDLTNEAASSPRGAHGLFWLPYLMGERTPHLDASARAAWVGLTAKHRRADMVRSVLEGVCFSQNDSLEIIRQLGASPTLVRLSGGGAKSAFWHQLFADVFNTPVAILENQEGSAYGAALLALVGTGEYKNVVELCAKAAREVTVKHPQPEAAAFYRQSYAVYSSLYHALKASFQAIAALHA